jgi:hypothetical protein
MNFSMIPGLARAYQEELLREAELHRLGNAAGMPKPRLRARLLARVGRTLISIGSRMVERSRPVLAGSSCICHDVTRQVPG